MANKRLLSDGSEFDCPPHELSHNYGSASAAKRLKDTDCSNQPFDEAQQFAGADELVDEPQLNEVNSAVKDLVTELVNTTTESEQLELSVSSLDDSFKLNYDFALVDQTDQPNQRTDDQLSQPVNELSTGQPIDDAFGSARFDSSFTEHNYANNCANVPSTSCATSSSTSENQSSHSHSSKPVKGALRFHNAMKSTNKKNVKFKGVTVFYFSRNQGGSTVPR